MTDLDKRLIEDCKRCPIVLANSGYSLLSLIDNLLLEISELKPLVEKYQSPDLKDSNENN